MHPFLNLVLIHFYWDFFYGNVNALGRRAKELLRTNPSLATEYPVIGLWRTQSPINGFFACAA